MIALLIVVFRIVEMPLLSDPNKESAAAVFTTWKSAVDGMPAL